MRKTVFSRNLEAAHGFELASTLIEEGQESMFRAFYAALDSNPRDAGLGAGAAIVWRGRRHLVLELSESEEARLILLCDALTGRSPARMMVCESVPALIANRILDSDEIEARISGHVQLDG